MQKITCRDDKIIGTLANILSYANLKNPCQDVYRIESYLTHNEFFNIMGDKRNTSYLEFDVADKNSVKIEIKTVKHRCLLDLMPDNSRKISGIISNKKSGTCDYIREKDLADIVKYVTLVKGAARNRGW